jgi:hypothetical protein
MACSALARAVRARRIDRFCLVAGAMTAVWLAFAVDRTTTAESED